MFERLVFDSEIEKEEFNKYVKIQGKYFYKQFYDIFSKKFKGDVSYSLIKSCVKYDKNLRDTLYIYLATFEEQLRAKIFDEYDINKDFSFKCKRKDLVDNIAKNIFLSTGGNSSILYEKFNLDLGETILLVRKLKFFNTTQCEEFDSIRVLRNRVMHHNVLVLGKGKTYNEMIKNKDDVKRRILDLANNLPDGYRENFLKELNEIKCDYADYKIIFEV